MWRCGGILATMIALAMPVAWAYSGTPGSVRFEDRADWSALKGVWRSRGYGWLMSVDAKQARFFDEYGGICVERPDRTERLAELGDERFALRSDRRVARLPLGDETYLYTFDRIDGLPADCGKSAKSQPMDVLNAIDQLFTAHYGFFAQRGIDWPSAMRAANKLVTRDMTEDELFGVVSKLLFATQDAHVGIEAEIDDETLQFGAGRGPTLTRLAAEADRRDIDVEDHVAEWEERLWNEAIGEDLLAERGRTAGQGRIRYGMLGRDIGYLAIRAMEGFDEDNDEEDDLETIEEVLDDAMARFSGATAVILDVSLNQGGYDSVARHIAGRFTATPFYGYSKRAVDDETGGPQRIVIRPSGQSNFTGAVYVVSSDVTLSAAEVLVLAMRALPNVVHVGGSTRGSLSDTLRKKLPNGWMLSLSNEAYLDIDGVLWEGVGIKPDVGLDLFPADSPVEQYSSAIRRLAAFARSVTSIGSQTENTDMSRP